ncbi:unnamed protein product, partial [Staurois parvus]
HFQSGHFYPLPVQANFQLSALSHLNDNCAVMQHCTHMNFLAFFETDKTLFWWYLFTTGI